MLIVDFNKRIWAARFSKLASQVLGFGHNVLLFGGNGECFFYKVVKLWIWSPVAWLEDSSVELLNKYRAVIFGVDLAEIICVRMSYTENYWNMIDANFVAYFLCEIYHWVNVLDVVEIILRVFDVQEKNVCFFY